MSSSFGYPERNKACPPSEAEVEAKVKVEVETGEMTKC
jgi:hypothetical protein